MLKLAFILTVTVSNAQTLGKIDMVKFKDASESAKSVPTKVNLQGYLTDSDSDPLNDNVQIDSENCDSCKGCITLEIGQSYYPSDNTDYQYHQTSPWWAVVGLRPDPTADWDIELYEDVQDFIIICNMSNLLISSAYGTGAVDFVVRNFNKAPIDNWDGVKVTRYSGDGGVIVEYETAHRIYVGTNTYYWPLRKVVTIYDVWLEPGLYVFRMTFSNSRMDLGFGLFFPQNTGTHAYSRSDLTHYSDHPAGQTETFEVNITSADWYGLVIWNNTGADGTDGYYTITIAQPSITVLEPNGGENWQIGSTHTIRWSSQNVSGDVGIKLYRGSSYVMTIASSTTNDGSYSWTIPSSLTPASNYRVKIYSTNNSSIYDFSDGYFTIYQALPDLITENLRIDESGPYHPGDNITIRVRVRNQGQGAASSSYVGYYIGTSPNDFSNRIDRDYVGSLSPGEYSDEHESVTLPTSLSPGTYYIIAKADYDNRVQESNEDNNSSYLSISISPTPQHTPEIVRINPSVSDTSVSVGNSVTFTVRVSDEDGDLDRVNWRLTRNGVTLREYDDNVSGNSANSSVTWLFDSEGDFVVHATVYDQQNHQNSISWNIHVEQNAPQVLVIGQVKITANSVILEGDHYVLTENVRIGDLQENWLIDLGTNSSAVVPTSQDTVIITSCGGDAYVTSTFLADFTGNVIVKGTQGIVSFGGQLYFGATFDYWVSSSTFNLNVSNHRVEANLNFGGVPMMPIRTQIHGLIDLDNLIASLDLQTGYRYEFANGLILLHIFDEGGGFSFDFQNLKFHAWFDMSTGNIFSIEVPLSSDVTLSFSPTDLISASFDITLDVPQRLLYLNKDASLWVSLPTEKESQDSSEYQDKLIDVSLGIVVDSGSYIQILDNTLILHGGGGFGVSLGARGFGVSASIAHLQLNSVLSDTLFYLYTDASLGIGDWLTLFDANGSIEVNPSVPILHLAGSITNNMYSYLFSMQGNIEVKINPQDGWVAIFSSTNQSVLFGFILNFGVSDTLFLWDAGTYGQANINVELVGNAISFTLARRGYSNFEEQIGHGEVTAGVHIGPINIGVGSGYTSWPNRMEVYVDMFGWIVTYTFIPQGSKGDTNLVDLSMNTYDGVTASLKEGILKGILNTGDTVIIADNALTAGISGVTAWLHPELDSSKELIFNKMVNVESSKGQLSEIIFESNGSDRLKMNLFVPGQSQSYLYKVDYNVADNSRAYAQVVYDGSPMTLYVDIDGDGVYETQETVIPDTIASSKPSDVLYIVHPARIEGDRNGNLTVSWTTSNATKTVVLIGTSFESINDTLYESDNYLTAHSVELSGGSVPDEFYLKIVSTDQRGGVITQGPIYVNKEFYCSISDTLRLIRSIGAPGTEVSMPVELTHESVVGGIQTTLYFDSDELTFQSAELNSQFSNFSLSSNNFGDSVRIVIVSLSGDSILPGTDTVFFVNFLVDSSATLGDSTFVDLGNTVLSDPHAQHIPVIDEGAWIYIMGTKGDLNQDGVVDVTDVVREINIILGRPPAPTPYEQWAGDMNNDGVIDVTDVVAIINVILGRGKTSGLTPVEASIRVEDGAVVLENSGDVAGIQFDLIGDVSEVRLADRASGFQLFTNEIPKGVRVVIVSMSGSAIPSGEGAVVEFDGRAEIRNVVMSDPAGRKVEVEAQRLPERVALLPVSPNPLSDVGVLAFELPNRASVRIAVYDATGRLVKVLADKTFEAGRHEIRFKADGFASGVYFVRLHTDGKQLTRKFVVR